MRIAIISDIHANITALEAVVDELNHNNVQSAYCQGDFVGYSAHHNEVNDRNLSPGPAAAAPDSATT